MHRFPNKMVKTIGQVTVSLTITVSKLVAMGAALEEIKAHESKLQYCDSEGVGCL